MGWEALDRWGHDVARIEPLAVEGVNDVWSVRVNGQLAVARLGRNSDRRTNADLAWEVELLRYLDREGMAVPVAIPTMDGRDFVDGLVVMSYVEGGPPETKAEWRRVADTFRQLHRLTRGWPQRPGWRSSIDFVHAERGTRIDLGAMPPEGVARCRAVWAQLNDRERCVVHGDPTPGNIRMTAERVALIDWDESRVDVPDLDLVLPYNAGGLDDDNYDLAAQAWAAWDAALCFTSGYREFAAERLAEVRVSEPEQRATVPDMLREVAEYPNSFGPLAEGDERIDTGRYTLCMGPGSTWNTVQRQRFPVEELDDVLQEVRATLRERGRTKTQWEVGSSAPDGLVEALLARGVVPDKDPYAVALVLAQEPPPVGPEFTARRVETLEELEAACEVQWEAFGATPAEVEEARALLPGRFADKTNLRHAVWLDGEIVSTGTAAPTEHGLLLYGGATAERARGRGAYRALNRARWDDAVALGTPVLITQGGSMSRPILERLGFERVGEVHMLLDVFE